MKKNETVYKKNEIIIGITMQEIERRKKHIASAQKEIARLEGLILEWGDEIMELKHKIHELNGGEDE